MVIALTGKSKPLYSRKSFEAGGRLSVEIQFVAVDSGGEGHLDG